MPLFQIAFCAIWRRRQSAAESPAPALTVDAKPASFLRLQYNLLPSNFYRACSVSAVSWGGVARLATEDGRCRQLAPVVRSGAVAAVAAQVEHDIDISLDGIMDLLHHSVGVVVTENKDAVPTAVRNRKPLGVCVEGGEEDQHPPPTVTLISRLVEYTAPDPEQTTEPAKKTGASKFRKRPSAQADSPDTAEMTDELGGHRPVSALFIPVSQTIYEQQFAPLVQAASEQVEPIPDVSPKMTKSDKGGKKVKGGGGKPAQTKKGKAQKSGHDKKPEPRMKKNKNTPLITFNMEFFFSGTDHLTMISPLQPESTSLVQMCVVLRAPTFLPMPRRVALNPLVVHLKNLQDMPLLPATFKTGGLSNYSSDRYDSEDNVTEDDREPPTFFASLKMPDGRSYVTKDVSYAVNVDLDELVVVFVGKLEPEQLWESIQTVPLTIEFFWRHSTPLVGNKRFQQMDIDPHIHDPNLVNIIKDSGNPFAVANPSPTKFAQVQVDLSAMTRGVRLLSLELPLTTKIKRSAAKLATAGIERGTCPPPFTPLELLDAGAQLSVSVSLAVALDFLPRPTPARCSYGRLMALLNARGLQRSGVLQLIDQLNDPPPPLGADDDEEATRRQRPPGDASTAGVSGFLLRDGSRQLLFAEGRADAELQRVWLSLRLVPVRDCTLVYHSGMLFAQRLYTGQPMFRVVGGNPMYRVLKNPRYYTDQKNEADSKAMRGLGECFRSQWLSDVMKQNLLPKEKSLNRLQELLTA